MAWYRTGSAILKDSSKIAISSTCCCCCSCDPLNSLAARGKILCVTLTGAIEWTTELYLVVESDPNICWLWDNSHEQLILYPPHCLAGDLSGTLELISLRCYINEHPPRLQVVFEPNGDYYCDLTENSQWIAPDTYDCDGTPFSATYTLHVVEAFPTCDCDGETITVTVTECDPP